MQGAFFANTHECSISFYDNQLLTERDFNRLGETMSVLFLFAQLVSIFLFGMIFYKSLFFFILGALAMGDVVSLWIIFHSVVISGDAE